MLFYFILLASVGFPAWCQPSDALISDEIGRVRGALAVHSDAYISNDL